LVGGKKEEKELKKGEVKPDGSLVIVDSEKIKTNDFELLLGQIKQQKEIIKTKKAELAKKHGYADEAKQILKEIKALEPKIKDTYLQSKYKKVASTSPSETNATDLEDYGSNLYQFSTRTETDDNQIRAIDYDKFVTYTNAHAHSLSTSTSEIDQAEYSATKLQGYLKAIQDRSKCLVDNKIKTDNHPDKGKSANGHRIEYSFGQDFTKHGSNTPQDNDTLIVLPAKANPMTKSDFTNFTPEDLGIPVDSNAKLINGIIHTGYHDFTNRQKLISSFTNDPIRQLFSDIRSYVQKDNALKTDKDGSGTSTPDYACFGSGTDPEESRLNEYETEKASLLEGVKTGRESLKTAEKALNEAKKELVKKKKEVDRFKKTATEDNRIELTSMGQIELLLKQIRYLENFDEEAPSSVNNEELARKELETLAHKIFTERDEDNKIFLVRYFRDGEGRTEAEKIESFEKNFGTKSKWVMHALSEVVTGFKNLEELVKLPSHYQDMKKSIEDYLAKKQEEEKPTD
ncbi:754_t:CDS:2, partial [Funneliformis geosporum]